MSERTPLPEAFRRLFEEIDEREDVIEEAFYVYVDRLIALKTNFIRGLILAAPNSDSDKGRDYDAYIFNILVEEYDPETVGIHGASIRAVGQAMCDFEMAVLNHLRLRMSNVRPTRIDSLRQKLQDMNMEVEEVYFY
ncbi:MAG: hypothetical protein UZ21_OP11001000538 [Microgenomates bacterium OLB22]|nr:MAG: hypothetical protein UZ21_OP11001000538 [Microgenomates bacterium OLB22]